jgi:hypothetical protein
VGILQANDVALLDVRRALGPAIIPTKTMSAKARTKRKQVGNIPLASPDGGHALIKSD